MIERDYVLRQIQQLIHVLQQVLLHRREGSAARVQEVLAEGLERGLGVELAQLRRLPRGELLTLCGSGEPFFGEKAVTVADLLREDDTPEGRERALWLYEAALASGDAVPLDIHQRIGALRASLEG